MRAQGLLQTHSKVVRLFQTKMKKTIKGKHIEQMKSFEFGASLERAWRISKLIPNSFLFSPKQMK
jgi:hypothetical protein